MPAPPFSAPDLIEVTVNQQLGSTTPSNVWFVRNNTGGVFSASLAEAVKDLFSTFYADLVEHMVTDWSVVNFTVRDRSGFPGRVYDLPPDVAIVGTNATQLLPRQTSLVCSLRTGFGGPRYRGRIYLCGFAEDENTDAGIPAAAMVTDISDALSDLRVACAAFDTPLQVASRGYNPGPPEVTWTPFSTEVTSTLVDSRWDTQRRRRLS